MSFHRSLGQTWIKHLLREQFLTTWLSCCDCWDVLSIVFLPTSPCSSLTEMENWIEDIKMAIEMAKTSNGPSSDLLTSNLTDNSKLLYKAPAEYDMYITGSSVEVVCCSVSRILSLPYHMDVPGTCKNQERM